MSFPERLYTIDILFAMFVLFFAAGGLRRGLSGELAHVLTLAALLSGFCFFYPQLSQFAARCWVGVPPWLSQTAVTVALLLVGVLLFVLVRAVFKQILKNRIGEVTDKVSGSVIGLIRGAVIGLAVLAGLSLIPSERLYQTISEKSAVGGWVCNTLTPWLYPRIMELPVFGRGEDRS